ncbi:MAG TPA: MCE family protein [Acidimicrobiales bacterium]|nr:MCE family protein [Acidimicrobiales bacterium]
MKDILLRRVLPLAVVAALIAGAWTYLSGGGDDPGDDVHLTAYFDRAVSLYPESRVKVMGLDAGEVLDVVPEGDRVRVELRVDGDIPLPADVEAAIVPLSLIGERNVVLQPAWQPGDPEAHDGDVIPIERTSIPAEPDEALQAFTDLARDLDPDEVARLITEGAESLDGRGQTLNDALAEAGDLTQLIAREDDALVAVAEDLDQLATTLGTRDEQLGQVLEGFADATEVLATEREEIQALLAGLGDLATTGNELVAAHEDHLPEDLAQLSQASRTARANVQALALLVEALAANSRGLIGAHDRELGVLVQRINLTPITAEVLRPFFEAMGIQQAPPCVPAGGMECP